MKRLVPLSLLLCLAATVVGCTLRPLHNDRQTHRSDPVTVSGFTISADQLVTVQCRPYLTGGSWTTIGTTNASGSPLTLPQGDLYGFSTSVTVPDDCWYHWHSQYTTELRFRGGDSANYIYATFDEEGIDCLSDAIFTDEEDFATARSECQLKTTSGTAAKSLYYHADN